MHTIIVSAFVASRPVAAQYANTVDLMNELNTKGFATRLCHGTYKGEQELSIAFDVPEGKHNPLLVKHLLTKYEQECVLFITREGTVYSVTDVPGTDYCSAELIGEWQMIANRDFSTDFTYVGGHYYKVA